MREKLFEFNSSFCIFQKLTKNYFKFRQKLAITDELYILFASCYFYFSILFSLVVSK